MEIKVFILYREFRSNWFQNPSSEVHFKGRHLPYYPWGYQNQDINVRRLCHVTHMDRLERIRDQGGNFVLMPQQKMGKQKTQRSGESYTLEANDNLDDIPAENRNPDDDTPYRMIPTDEAVLPGYYIWWSIHKTDNPLTPREINVSDLFSNPRSSVYGDRMISTTSLHLLQSYQDGFIDDVGHYPDLQFRNGGTLRYKHEICYVVIVCAKDRFTGADDDYPVMDAFNIVYAQQDNRVIETVERDWHVTIKNGITQVWQQRHPPIRYKDFSYDHYVFAFHFDEYQTMTIQPNDANDVENVIHSVCINQRCNPAAR